MMRAIPVRRILLPCVAVATLAIGAAAFAHLPRYATIQSESGVARVRTYGATVGDAVAAAGLVVAPQDRVLPAPDTPLQSGMTIRVRRAFPVRLFADGRPRVAITAARTVGEFLAEAGLTLRPRDQTHPALEASLWPGATVRVVRIDTRIVAVEERLPFARVARPDPTLPRGRTRLVQAGRPGARMRRIAVTTADGFEVSRQQVEAVIVRPPQDRILQVGTRRVVAARGEFAGREVIHMEATAYAPWHGKGVDGTTAIGLRAGYGVVAVDPRFIPLRSILFIEGYGRAIAGDTGGAIKGNRIDLGFSTPREAYQFGRRPVRVYVLSTPSARR